jgi:adenine C2-methylase RlmN of 23S rRNA A2503 and tRNA A37
VNEAKADKLNLVGASRAEIEERTVEPGEARFPGRQLFAGIYRLRLRCWEMFTDLARPLREKLGHRAVIAYPEVGSFFQLEFTFRG